MDEEAGRNMVKRTGLKMIHTLFYILVLPLMAWWPWEKGVTSFDFVSSSIKWE